MKRAHIDKILLILSILAFATTAFSLVLMAEENLGILPGILFWSGLLVGCGLQAVLACRRKQFIKKHRSASKMLHHNGAGLWKLASNISATIADCVMLLCLIATACMFIFTDGTSKLCFALIGATFFSFCMHCILNGKIFNYVKNQAKIARTAKQKEISQEKGEKEK